MNEAYYQNCLKILQTQLVKAMGCTEPIAIAYSAAKARAVLGEMPERIEVYCSGNIVKNVKGVTVPNSEGMRGIDVAAVLGTVGGNADKELEVIASATSADVAKTRELLANGFCQCHLEEGVENLYIRTVAFAGEHSASVTIRDHHTDITEITRDGEVIFKAEEKTAVKSDSEPDRSLLTLKGILEFADTVKLEDIAPLMEMQVTCNTELSNEGLRGNYGAQVGKTLLEKSNDVATRAAARAAAGSDARMSGCALPAVINSGSGNQGITVTMPVVTYAEELGCSTEKLYRALVVSNLMAVHQKKYIGSLSAYCGVVSASCAAGVGILYLQGADYDTIGRMIINTLGNVGGIICDGAKSSCAAKIAAAINAVHLAIDLSKKGLGFQPGEGIVLEDVEATIRSMGYVGRVGMKQTDIEVLNIMLGKTDVSCGC